MTTAVSLWGNFVRGAEYPDEKLFETKNTLIIKYCGQNCGQNDKHVGVGNYFFVKKSKTQKDKYTFVGRVIQYTQLGNEIQFKRDAKTQQYKYYNVQTFELVISKEPEYSFRIKEDAYKHFGWKIGCGNIQSGIIEHTLL